MGMPFENLVSMVIEYADAYNCTIKIAINDLEFDGPYGSSGPSVEDQVALLNHFGSRVEMHVNVKENGALCYYYSEEYIVLDDANTIAELLSL